MATVNSNEEPTKQTVFAIFDGKWYPGTTYDAAGAVVVRVG